ncbi:MAG: hypothetical protein AAFQ58_01070 [Pseudomonadota bacterium]
MMKFALRVAATAVLVTAIGIIFFSQTPSSSGAENRSALRPPNEVTPEIVAMRGCIEGVSHPSGAKLSNQEQIAACNEHVRMAENKTQARYFRGLHLFKNATINAHRTQAYDDLTFVIDAGTDIPSAYGNRAVLNLRDRNAPERALADVDKAIELTTERPRSYFFERRALILLSLAERDADEAMVHAALDDIGKARSLNPNSHRNSQLEKWAAEFLKRLHQNEGRQVQKG